MTRTPRNIIRHELIGLECEVVDAGNKSCIGVKGMITDETSKTLVIGGKRVFKKNSVFRIMLAGRKTDVEGGHLVGRPEERIKKKIKKW